MADYEFTVGVGGVERVGPRTLIKKRGVVKILECHRRGRP